MPELLPMRACRPRLAGSDSMIRILGIHCSGKLFTTRSFTLIEQPAPRLKLAKVEKGAEFPEHYHTSVQKLFLVSGRLGHVRN
jgi:quercetin dioxygenase-like cupin family protein